MTVESAIYHNEENTEIDAVIDGVKWIVPVDESNRLYQQILDWEFGPLEDVDGFMVRPTEQINTIEPYVPPVVEEEPK